MFDWLQGGEDFWNSLLTGLASVFLGPARDQLPKTLAALNNDVPPNLAGDVFMSQYQLMWGAAAVVAIPALLLQLFRLLSPTGTDALTKFVNILIVVTVVGHLGVAILWVIQTISGYTTDWAMLLAGDGEDYSFFDRLVQLPALNGPSATLLSFLQWFFDLVLQFEAFVTQNSIVIVGTFIVLAAVLSYYGKLGDGFKNVIFGLCAACLISPTLMILVLVAGARMGEAVDVTTVPAGYASFNVAVMGIAAYAPIWVYRFFIKRYSHVLSGQTDVSGSTVSSEGGGPRFKTAALAAGGGAALMKILNTDTPRAPTAPANGSTPEVTPPQVAATSTVRRIAHTALSSAGVQAAAKAHPYLAVAAHVGAFVVKPRDTPAPPQPPTLQKAPDFAPPRAEDRRDLPPSEPSGSSGSSS